MGSTLMSGEDAAKRTAAPDEGGRGGVGVACACGDVGVSRACGSPVSDRHAEPAEGDAAAPKIAVLCVGNKLMLDDGLGPAVYEELVKRYRFPENVELFDIGCLSMDMLFVVDRFDVVISVDAVDGTDSEPGTVFRFAPDAMARHSGATASLHDLKLVDLFDAATLLGYEAEGLCLGMQVENPSPAEVTMGLTPKVHAALPLLVDTVVGELRRLGADVQPAPAA